MKQTIYIILLCLLSGLALQTEVMAVEPPQLFFSEYIEGSGHNKALELYNSGLTPVDLSEYIIRKDVNGNGVFGNGISLTGTVAPKSTYVIVNDEAAATLINKADMYDNSGCLNFNGNDMVKLYHNGVAIDSIGSRGGSNFGKDVTLVSSRGMNQDIKGRWLKLPKDYTGQLGVHDITVQPKLIISEYQEGSGYNKSIEITNLGIANCDISNIVIQRDQDGDNDFRYAYTPEKSGILEVGKTIVIRNSKAIGNNDKFVTTNNSVVNFNGNDQIRILYRGIETDRIGSAAPRYFAKDKLLTRKSDVIIGHVGHKDYVTDEWISKPDINSILTLAEHVEERADFEKISLSHDRNYVVTYVPKEPVKSLDKSNIVPDKVAVNVNYVDGRGRVKQSISVAASVSGKDIIVPIEYDKFGRNAKKYLPYASSAGTGAIATSAISDQGDYYNIASNVQEVTKYPFSVTKFDNSPLNRVTKQGAPGEVWQPIDNGEDHTTKFYYDGNSANDVYEFFVDIESGKLICNTYHQESTLYLNATVDENSKGVIMEYKNQFGEIVLKRSPISGSEKADTYYVYDDFGMLRYVLSPKASEVLMEMFDGGVPDIEFSANDQFIKNLCYYYCYDERKRMITKQLPGAEPIYMVYDRYDRLVLTQDGEQRKTNQWLYTKYDRFNRPVQTGIYTAGSALTQEQMRIEVEANSNMYEVCNGGLYSKNCFPNVNTELLTQTVYDNYYQPRFSGVDFKADYAIDSYSGDYNRNVKGLVTYNIVKVLDGDDSRREWVITGNYYDDKYRNIQSVSEITLPGGKVFTEVAATNYSFTGRVDSTLYAHQLAGNSAIVVRQRNEYDHADRLLRIYQKLSGAITKSEILYASFEYDELGQMIKKRLNNKAINTEYSYNIRGWLKELNNTKSDGSNLYSMNLYYNNTLSGVDTEAQYNGNISAIQWKNGDKGVLHSYGYRYDNIDRIKRADYAGAKQDGYNTAYSYDINGNILTLDRSMVNITTSVVEPMDKLTYNYDSGNQLRSVVDAGTEDGFRQGIGNYIYDANGNMIVDPNKGLSDIKYNHMNLPYSITKGENSIGYVYDATGRKLANILPVNDTIFYSGSFVYRNGDINYMICSDGLLNINGSTTNYEFHLKDHLGNTRVAVNENCDTTQVNNYYPFGLTFATSGSSTNKYLYNDKEKQDETDWLAYGARFYDACIGRFFNHDRLAEKYVGITPYQYGGNNPIKSIDVNGDYIYVIHDSILYMYSNQKMYRQNTTSGRYEEYNPQNNTFIQGLLNSLNELATETNEGGKIIDFFANRNNHAYLMKNPTNNENRIDMDTPYNIIQIDPRLQGALIPTQNGNQRSPLWLDLGHELAHRQDILENGLTQAKAVWETASDGTQICETEKYATHRENIMRAEKGMPLRTHYVLDSNGNPWQPTEIIDSNRTSKYITFSTVKLPNWRAPIVIMYKY